MLLAQRKKKDYLPQKKQFQQLQITPSRPLYKKQLTFQIHLMIDVSGLEYEFFYHVQNLHMLTNLKQKFCIETCTFNIKYNFLNK